MATAAEQYNTSGKKCYMNKRYDDAVEQYTKAIKMNPLPKYYQNRAMCHYQLNDLKMTEEDCKRALELSPNEVKPLYFLGSVYLKGRRYNDAINCLSKALYHNAVITNAADIENALKRARHQKFEEEESKRIIQDVEFHTYLESLIDKDRQENAENPEALQRADMAKKRLTEITSAAQEKRQNREIPEIMCGKITLELMKDPVIVPSGITYDREEIVQHLRRIGHFDPVTRKPLTENEIIPNYALKEVIEKFLDDNPWAKYEPGAMD
ncbi:Protein CBR-CHN-1 [Caenorhabditis briggsae]|uniref:E3 ubiquitin-protein ligase CHIP n=2 Tax=Caenorhabditis briggsae TaxID=6238 RepID=A0AAE9E4A3_CAEBR|nr:Protein CBR-CHN-1 [Caenorhabditis briggsae]ULU12659.1 hypothetical protein L3Y34_015720 [Caenorhabditis briggsae]UMM13614.1 hypothetical protein L5515_001794 [Caenorhabditis briggsae]CAP31513.1 Protein CBR-CHN-1 [Caenorhabditis briggsae]